jgi:hypothetical protein
MTFDFFTCECGKAHLRGARFCDRCGSQPPQRVGNERVNGTEVAEEDVSATVAAFVAIGDALVGTGGKWGCA